MGASRLKRKKVRDDAEDRISNLPDSVLCYILSFLPTKDAGRTSILSTRWKYLFVSSPNLDFDDSLRVHPLEVDCGRESRRSFVNFVYRVLALRSSLHMNRFRLKCDVNDDDPHVNTWVSAVARCNVRELELKLDVTNDLTKDTNLDLLPCDLLTCRTLAVLKLEVNGDLNVPSDVSFPSLKTLHLKFLFLDYESFKRVLSGCPVLEDLLTFYCRFIPKVQVFDISIPTLKRLTLGLQYLSTGGEVCESEVVVDAPCLQYLRYSGNVAKRYAFKGLTSPAEVHLCITQDRLSSDQQLIKLFEAISKVESLHLSENAVWVLEVNQCWLPAFPNLTRLELDTYSSCRFVLLPELLYCSPNLKVLVIGRVVFLDVKGDMISSRTASCLSSHLKEIELKEFNGKNDELELVEYFLERAEVLEKMTISFFAPRCPRKEFYIGKKLLTIPRRSKTCRIILT
ncbi:F-box protein At4g22280-like [Malania oleifera]|uniref:F-box protein At4g22280-like n=1 Tax=Malania oleifera TaxID=397392 RepID=UPI0025AE8401|nr:F-box protein At4g22280-like [Malania oleifera]